LLGGCFELFTADRPLGPFDPNEAQLWFDAGVTTGKAMQSVGAATGNPALIGMGVLVATIAGVLGFGYLKKGGE